ncbi:MAG: aspartate aminotransferase family protein [Gammaproteobacteria bacterium]|nr:aspartate aminotransferase family protein [Gammaproteobacteria bacterium]
MNKSRLTRQTFNEIMVPNYAPQAMIPVRGEGSRIWDQSGNEYIDFAGGIAVNALGHCHPELLKILKDQSEKLWHLSNVYTNEPALAFAQKMVSLTFADKIYFCNSGAEANEAAFKLARKYAYDKFSSEKNEIIAFQDAFHGRSLFTVTVGGQAKYQTGFAPLPSGVRHVPFNDLKALKATISNKTCAVVLEIIQGEGGVITADPTFLQGAQQLCQQYDALLIVDEIQTGVGRTGQLYAYMDNGIIPDIMTSAKALGCGFPVAAMLTTHHIANSLSFGTHGSTYGGNPLACAVALEAFSIISESQLLTNVSRKYNLFRECLAHINKKYNLFSDIRGKGLLIGAELNQPWHGMANKFIAAAETEGLMLLMAGPNVLRMTPSLIIPDDDIQVGMKKLERAVANIIHRR